MATPVLITLRAIDETKGGILAAEKNLEGLGTAADKAAVRMAALKAKQAELGQAVASGKMTVDQAAGALRQFSDSLGVAERSAGGTARGTLDLGNAVKGAIEIYKQATLAVGIFAGVAKKSFDLAEQGAAILQVRDSFDRMNESVYQTPELLERMREAVRGTVSDTNLMRGLLLLTAGTSQELGQAFADAAPKLLEIAKAANKLNPALGDTAFLYDSISRGVKRGSTLILDNLGLVIKVGEANEKYAQQLGKTITELTAEDKQMALLNATLEAGDQLIGQVGGTTESAVDPFQRLRVETQGLTTDFKVWLAEGLTPVVEVINGDYGNAAEELITKNQEAANSIDEMVAAGQRLDSQFNLFLGLGAAVTGTEDEIRQGILGIAQEMAGSSSSFEAFQQAIDEAFGVRTQNALAAMIQQSGLTEEQFYALARRAELLAQDTAELDDKQLVLELRMRRVAAAGKEEEKEFTALRDETGAWTREAEDMISAATEAEGAFLELGFGATTLAGYMIDLRLEAAGVGEEVEDLAPKIDNLTAAAGGFFAEAISGAGEVGLLTVALNNLGQQTVIVGGLNEEQEDELGRLQGEYDKTAQAIRDYEMGLKGVGQTDEQRAENMAELQTRLENITAAMGPYLAVTGEAVSVNNEFAFSTSALNTAMFEALETAGAGPGTLAEWGVAAGLMGEDTAEAALKVALMKQKIDELAAAVVAGTMTVEEAQGQLESFRNSLETGNIPANEAAAESFNLAASKAAEMGAAINTTTSEALLEKEAIIGLTGEMDKVPPEINTKVNVDTGAAAEALGRLMSKVDALIAKLEGAGGPEGGGTGNGAGPGGAGGGAQSTGQSGLHMVIPPGFPNDSYTVGVSSGEKVDVWTAAEMARGSGNVATGPGLMMGSDEVVFGPGSIVVNAAPGMNEEALAERVASKVSQAIAKKTRQRVNAGNVRFTS